MGAPWFIWDGIMGSTLPHLPVPCWSLSLGIAGGSLLISNSPGASFVTRLGCKLGLFMLGWGPVLPSASLWLEQEVGSSLPAQQADELGSAVPLYALEALKIPPTCILLLFWDLLLLLRATGWQGVLCLG